MNRLPHEAMEVIKYGFVKPSSKAIEGKSESNENKYCISLRNAEMSAKREGGFWHYLKCLLKTVVDFVLKCIF